MRSIMCAGRLSPCVRAALDLTVMEIDLDVTGIFFIVLTFEYAHFGIRWYVVCCGTWPQSVSQVRGERGIRQGRSAPGFVFVGWGLGSRLFFLSTQSTGLTVPPRVIAQCGPRI